LSNGNSNVANALIHGKKIAPPDPERPFTEKLAEDLNNNKNDVSVSEKSHKRLPRQKGQYFAFTSKIDSTHDGPNLAMCLNALSMLLISSGQMLSAELRQNIDTALAPWILQLVAGGQTRLHPVMRNIQCRYALIKTVDKAVVVPNRDTRSALIPYARQLFALCAMDDDVDVALAAREAQVHLALVLATGARLAPLPVSLQRLQAKSDVILTTWEPAQRAIAESSDYHAHKEIPVSSIESELNVVNISKEIHAHEIAKSPPPVNVQTYPKLTSALQHNNNTTLDAKSDVATTINLHSSQQSFDQNSLPSNTKEGQLDAEHLRVSTLSSISTKGEIHLMTENKKRRQSGDQVSSPSVNENITKRIRASEDSEIDVESSRVSKEKTTNFQANASDDELSGEDLPTPVF